MRHPLLLAAALLATTSLLAAPAAAQKAPAAHSPHAAPAAKAAPASAAPVLDVNKLAAAAALDATAKARVAPHVAAMNAEMAAMHGIMDRFSRTLPKEKQDSIHQALKVHYDTFDRHWQEADALIPAPRRSAFDVAVRQQMGARAGTVGNPHQNLPATHPKLDKNGSAAKK